MAAAEGARISLSVEQTGEHCKPGCGELYCMACGTLDVFNAQNIST